MPVWVLKVIEIDELARSTTFLPWSHDSGYVVVAPSEALARQLAHDVPIIDRTGGAWWLREDQTSCRRVDPEGDMGIVMAQEPWLVAPEHVSNAPSTVRSTVAPAASFWQRGKRPQLP